MADIAGVNHEGWFLGQLLDAGDCLAQGGERIRIGGFAEADMAVADLQEGEGRCGGFGSERPFGRPEREMSARLPEQHRGHRRQPTPCTSESHGGRFRHYYGRAR